MLNAIQPFIHTFQRGWGRHQGAILGSLWRNNDDHLNANEGPSRLKRNRIQSPAYFHFLFTIRAMRSRNTKSNPHSSAERCLAAGASSDGQSCAARCLYLHHDGHAQRVFGDVFLAFLARSAPALGIFRFVQLVLLRLRHVANRREADEWATRWLCRGTFLQPEDDGEKQQQPTERSTSPRNRAGEPACLLHDIKEGAARTGGLTPSRIPYPLRWMRRSAHQRNEAERTPT